MTYLMILKAVWAHRRLVLSAAAAVMLLLAARYLHKQGEAAERNRQLVAAMTAYVDGAERSWLVGMNLETGLNEYRAAALKLDKEVNHATSNDSGCRADAGSVQRTTARIAAGEAARRRIQ